jgi:DNA-binding transcriptional LysR family regulator
MLDYRTETFMTLYKEMNYRKTAEVLGMTQPGVTQHIHFLESHYGVKLFSYDGRQLSRTPQAELLKRHIDSVRAKERTLCQSLTQSPGLHLEVGATKTIGEFVLPGTLERFLSDCAHSIHFVIDNTERLLQMLENSELDFAVIEGVFDKGKFGCHLYKKEKFVGVCGKEHPFAGKIVSLDDCFQQSLILREPGSGTRKLLEQAIFDRGYDLERFRRCVSVSNFSVILDLVARGDGITFGYAPIAARENLATFTVEDMPLSGEFNFVYCDEDTAKEKIAQFFDFRR